MIDDDIISAVILREGSEYTNNPADKGGPTKYGITQATLAKHRGHDVSPADVEAMTEAEARSIYRRRYIEDPGFLALGSPELRGVITDCCVLHGQSNAIKMLQRALGVVADGKLGPVTITAANSFNGKRLALRTMADRLAFTGRLISKDLDDNDKDGIPDNAEFAWGWMNRYADIIRALA